MLLVTGSGEKVVEKDMVLGWGDGNWVVVRNMEGIEGEVMQWV